MGKPLIFIASLLLMARAGAASPPVSESALLGTWHCGPITVPLELGMTHVVTERITRFPDRTYIAHSTFVVSFLGRPVLDVEERSGGIWALAGNALRMQVLWAESSTPDPSEIRDEADNVHGADSDDLPLYEFHVLESGQDHTRFVPVKTMGTPRAIEFSCERARQFAQLTP